MKIQRNRAVITLLLLAGFLIGILYANFAPKQYMAMGIFSEYFLSQYPAIEFMSEEYFWYILKIRLLAFLTVLVLGSTKIRKQIVMAVLLWTGISGGILIVSSIIQLGVKGILLCMIALTPHFLFYIMAYTVVLWYFYTYPKSQWNSSKTIFVVLTMGLGIIMEVYVNPILMKMFLKTI